MAKQGMKRPSRTHPKDASGASQKVWHTERPIPSDAYGPIDTDLGRDNLEQDIPFADLQDI